MRPGPLAGVVVLDLGQAAVAPVAATYLGLLGASVVKVEAPGGDMVRSGEPTMRGTSTTFIGNNWTKYGVRIDLKDPAGKERLRGLLARADLLIENFRSPQVLERLGFDAATMAAINPRLVYVESSAFGDGGSYGDMISNEWITEALGGMVSVTGEPGHPEFMRGTSLLDWSGAMVNAVVCLAALLDRDRTGRGSVVRTSQLGSTVFAGLTRVVESMGGRTPRPQGSAGHAFAPDGAFATRDGYLGLSAPTQRTWTELTNVLGLGPVVDPDLADNAARVRHREQLTAVIEAALARRTTSQWLELLSGSGVPHTTFPRERWLSDELAGHPQVIAGGHLVALPTPWGLARTAGPHWHFSRTPVDIPRPAPVLGQDDAMVESILPAPQDPATGPATGDVLPDDGRLRPLAGRRVLAVASGVCGPLAGRLLAELGADVVKLEPPQGDWLRDAAPGGRSSESLYRSVNAGTTARTADLRTAEGRQILETELAESEVVLWGLETDQLDRLGLRVLDGRAVQEGRVVCQVTGWGARGPWAGRPATELDLQAAVGMYHHLGSPGAAPVRTGFDLVSLNTALAAVQAVLAAAYERERSALGQRCEVSMLGTAVALSQWGLTAESRTDRPRGLQLEGYDLPPDLGVRCGDGRACRLDFRKDHRTWARLFERLGLHALVDDPRFGDEQALGLHRHLLGDLLDGPLKSWSFAELDAFVRDLGGTIVPVLGIDEVIADPQVRALGVVDFTDPAAVRLPYRISHPRPTSEQEEASLT